MNLIILAAGYGGRLTPATENTPKALLDLGHGITILDRQLEAAKECNITDVNIIIGYQAEKIETKVRERSDLGLNINIYYNPFYRTTNNLVSLWMARSAMCQDFIMLNGDDIFRTYVLKELIETKGELMAIISRKNNFDSDDTKIITNSGKINNIGKDIPANTANAEWIGMCAVRGAIREIFIKKMDFLIRDPSLREGSPHYLSIFQELIGSGVKMEFHEIASESWAEVDFQSDLTFVRENIKQFNTKKS